MISYFLSAVFLVVILIVAYRRNSDATPRGKRMIIHFTNGKHQAIHIIDGEFCVGSNGLVIHKDCRKKLIENLKPIC